LQIDYKLKDKFELGIFFPALFLIIIGLLAVFSATSNNPAAEGNFQKQLFWAVLSIVIFFIVYFLPTNTFRMISI